MDLITKSEWQEWKSNKVTKAFMDAAQQRIQECSEILSYSAGNDPIGDRLLVGMCQAYREMQDFYVETEEVKK